MLSVPGQYPGARSVKFLNNDFKLSKLLSVIYHDKNLHFCDSIFLGGPVA